MKKTMYRMVLVALACLQLSLSSRTAMADEEVVYVNTVFNPIVFVFSDLSAANNRIADDAVVAETSMVTSVEWTGSYLGTVGIPATDDFRIEVYADDNGVPKVGPPLAIFNVGNDVNRMPFENGFSYSAEISFRMEANQRYWYAIVNNLVGMPVAFALRGDGAAGDAHVSANNGKAWGLHPTSLQVDFALCGNVIMLGDVNLDGQVSNLDIAPFQNLIISGGFQQEADINGDGFVNLLDVAGFVEILQDQ